jgi:S-layer homology domain.
LSSAPQFSAPEGSVDITANRVELSNTPSNQAKPIATAGKTVRITSTVDVLELHGDINAGTTDSPDAITLQSAKEISWSCADSTGNLTATATDGYFEMWPVGGGSAATLHGSAVLTAHNSVDMNRAEIWSVLYRQNVGNAADSTTGKWYENAQKWAQEQNLSDGTNPTGEISRQQMVTILWRAAGSPKADGTLTGYADAASAADYAKEALTWAVKVGIISGTDADTLNPGGDASRLQVAAILMRYLQMNVQ